LLLGLRELDLTALALAALLQVPERLSEALGVGRRRLHTTSRPATTSCGYGAQIRQRKGRSTKPGYAAWNAATAWSSVIRCETIVKTLLPKPMFRSANQLPRNITCPDATSKDWPNGTSGGIAFLV